jgi:hypothetical protein
MDYKHLRSLAHGAEPDGVDGGWTIDNPDPSRATAMLAAGSSASDAVFDQCMEEPMRRLSAQHWTPLAVAARAAEWLEACNVRTVLDIGSGVGKFCVAAALASRCHFTGLEQRGHLVGYARALARTFGVQDRTYFIHGTLADARLPTVDAYYLYNPFGEHTLEPAERIDDHVALGEDRSARDQSLLQALLSRAPAGTYTLTYDGSGGDMPGGYRKLWVARDLPNELCLWRKTPTYNAIRRGSHRWGVSGSASAA